MATVITRREFTRKTCALPAYRIDAARLPGVTAALGAILGISLAVAGVTVFSVVLLALALAGSVGFIMSHHH